MGSPPQIRELDIFSSEVAADGPRTVDQAAALKQISADRPGTGGLDAAVAPGVGGLGAADASGSGGWGAAVAPGVGG